MLFPYFAKLWRMSAVEELSVEIEEKERTIREKIRNAEMRLGATAIKYKEMLGLHVGGRLLEAALEASSFVCEAEAADRNTKIFLEEFRKDQSDLEDKLNDEKAREAELRRLSIRLGAMIYEQCSFSLLDKEAYRVVYDDVEEDRKLEKDSSGTFLSKILGSGKARMRKMGEEGRFISYSEIAVKSGSPVDGENAVSMLNMIVSLQEKKVQEEKAGLQKGLDKTKESVFKKISRAIAGKTTVDDEVLDNLEEVLVTSDVGVETTLQIIERLQERVKRDKYLGTAELNKVLREEITDLLVGNKPVVDPWQEEGKKPYVIMVVGVNGVGKTTTIGKLAYLFKQNGAKVVLGAADTFRAAAVEQLQEWGRRVDVPVIAQNMGSDPASVAFDTLKSAVAKDADLVIIDTAGRLHNKVGLMNELTKIKNVMKKVVPDAPHEVLLVLDASTGQNAIEQAKQFTAATEVNALALTKLDGTAKGGVAIGISAQFKIPIKYIGVGEKMTDLQLFDKQAFVDSLFE